MSDAMQRLERKYVETCGQRDKNTQRNQRSMIPIGSKYEPKSKPVEKVHLEPIKQVIGRKAVPWKTKSVIKGDFSY